MRIQEEVESGFTAIFFFLSDVSPVVDGTRSEVCVENSDDGRRRVSQDGIVNDVQKINQLKQTERLFTKEWEAGSSVALRSD